jgi:hypothetical protein
MASGLELRTLFLDRDLMTVLSSIPVRARLPGQNLKQPPDA